MKKKSKYVFSFPPRARPWAVECSYRGFDIDRDRAIEKAARTRSVGSGMSLVTGMRDLEFEFATEVQAKRAVERIKKTKMRVRLWMRGRWRV